MKKEGQWRGQLDQLAYIESEQMLVLVVDEEELGRPLKSQEQTPPLSAVVSR